MSQVTLIYFEGCPNAEKARRVLEASGKPFTEVRQDDLSDDHPQRAYTSPSILADGEIIYGMLATDAGCSILPLNPEAVLAKLGE